MLMSSQQGLLLMVQVQQHHLHAASELDYGVWPHCHRIQLAPVQAQAGL